MKSYIRLFIGAAAMSACVGSLSGCFFASGTRTVHHRGPARPTEVHTTKTTVIKQSGPTTAGYGRKHQFYYYPDAQVYRDCESNNWHYVENNTWKISVELPKRIVLDHDGPVAIDLDGNDPSPHHARVCRENPGRKSGFDKFDKPDKDDDKQAWGRDKDKDKGKDKDKDRYGRGKDKDDDDSNDRKGGRQGSGKVRSANGSRDD